MSFRVVPGVYRSSESERLTNTWRYRFTARKSCFKYQYRAASLVDRAVKIRLAFERNVT